MARREREYHRYSRLGAPEVGPQDESITRRGHVQPLRLAVNVTREALVTDMEQLARSSRGSSSPPPRNTPLISRSNKLTARYVSILFFLPTDNNLVRKKYLVARFFRIN